MSEVSKKDVREGIAWGFLQSMGPEKWMRKQNVSFEVREGVVAAITDWLNENKEDVLKAIANAAKE
jgi:hypothetical protein